MATRPEIADPAVDELKRRARRRLVGAVVLALAAAVLLPMLLESDPKPLGNDVSIQIPPVDQGKFVPPSPPDKSAQSKAATETHPATPPDVGSPAPAPERTLGAAEQRVLGQSGANRAPAIMSSAPEAMRPQTPVAAAPSAAPTAKSGAEPAPAAGGTLFVQVAALADSQAAAELAAKLLASGFPAHVEPVATRQGPVQRVRVGGYPSREAADVALANIKAAGYGNAIITQ
ncbi:MAG TPA: SPOR domain-containing protein [Casimicrobiaceae bacterium]|nr:SPOR domain-containing protein [Casimicrobiaceae bacterium]